MPSIRIERKIVIDEEDYRKLPQIIARELLAWSRLPYGVKLVSPDTGEEIQDEALAVGSLLMPLERALGLVGQAGDAQEPPDPDDNHGHCKDCAR